MKPTLLFSALALTVTCAPPLAAQGTLDPAGPPAPGMVHLGQLNAGTALTAPTTISKSGRYYLAANLGGEIVIHASRVVLDLNGFQLKPGEGAIGILAESLGENPLHGVTVINGCIDGGLTAVKFINVCNGTIADLSIQNTTEQAIRVNATIRSDGNRIERCSMVSCAGGIWLLAENEGTECRGNVIRSCVLSGIGPPFWPISIGGDGTCGGNLIQDCLIGEAVGTGLQLRVRLSGRCEGNRVSRCALSGNGGIDLIAVLGGTVTGNDVTGCAVHGAEPSDSISLSKNSNDPDSSLTGNRIEGCAVTGNDAAGIRLQGSSGNIVRGCLVHNTPHPSGASIFCSHSSEGNRIVGNHLAAGSRGIQLLDSTDTLLTGNSIIDHPTPFEATSSTYTRGPLVGSTGILGTTGPEAHPWANFTR